jgi:hypothetical protein
MWSVPLVAATASVRAGESPAADDGQQGGIVRELDGVDQHEVGGPRPASCDDQPGDLDDLTFATCARARPLLRVAEVLAGTGGVAVVDSTDGQEGLLDRIHERRVRRRADTGLTPR